MTSSALLKRINTHVVDILGHVKGRDQPIMLFDKALELVACADDISLTSDDYVFLDPFCKAGEILLASAFLRCFSIHQENKISKKEIAREIYSSNSIFGLAPDERHFRLSTRTYYGNEHSHNPEIANTITNGNYLSETDGRLDERKFKTELNKMIDFIKKQNPNKKIIAIGNPPYQESDGGAGSSAKPIYNYFVEALIDSKEIDELVMVIPARWFGVGKGLDNFRSRILNSKEIKTIKYFSRSEDVFPTVHVQGGICFLNWKKDFNGETSFIEGKDIYKLDLTSYDILPDDPKAYPIIEKVLEKASSFISEVAWPRKPFGLATNFFNDYDEPSPSSKNAIKCYTRRKSIKYIDQSIINKNEEHISRWKVATPAAYATGARRCTLPKHQIFLIEKDAVCTETYTIIKTFKTKKDAMALINYLQTDVARYLLGLRKLTQHVPRDRWSWVPIVDYEKHDTEEKVVKALGLTKEELNHIKNKVKEWS